MTLLCDIGNTHYHFFENGRSWDIAVDSSLDSVSGRDCYVISVNDNALERLQEQCRVTMLDPLSLLDTDYKGLGEDRAAACLAINDGIVVDAGSAITVDIMQSGVHLGGFITPGIASFTTAFAAISPRLSITPALNVDLSSIPQSTQEALGYGIVAPIVLCIEEVSKGKPIYCTGGDGAFLARYLKRGVADKLLVFRGMQKLIERLS